ncbi:hypothetical protein L9F63_012606, partial [Diploptera punctata]
SSGNLIYNAVGTFLLLYFCIILIYGVDRNTAYNKCNFNLSIYANILKNIAYNKLMFECNFCYLTDFYHNDNNIYLKK